MITRSAFGTTTTGIPVEKITLQAHGLTASFLTKGVTLQSVRLDGVAHDLTLGSEALSDYEGKMRHHGSLVVPVVNRLSGGKARVNGVELAFELNQAGKHTLHSGAAGGQHRVWEVEQLTETHVTLGLRLAHGEGGFPGNRHIRARLSIGPGPALRMEVTAETDAPTLFNAANHSYWNLDGTETWAGHELRIAANHFLPTTEDFTPTGEIAPVSGAMDFRRGRVVTPADTVLDTNFCLSGGRQPLREVLWLRGRDGVALTVATTEAGIQVYDARNAARPGRGFYEGLAIEAQAWPDAPNHPGFPAIDLRPGEPVTQVTEWRFNR